MKIKIHDMEYEVIKNEKNLKIVSLTILIALIIFWEIMLMESCV